MSKRTLVAEQAEKIQVVYNPDTGWWEVNLYNGGAFVRGIKHRSEKSALAHGEGMFMSGVTDTLETFNRNGDHTGTQRRLRAETGRITSDGQ